MVFVCYFSDPFAGGGYGVLLDQVEGFCGEDVEGGLGWRYVRVFLWGVVEVFGCFLSYNISCFNTYDVLRAGTLMIWMDLWGGMSAMAFRMHEVRCL